VVCSACGRSTPWEDVLEAERKYVEKLVASGSKPERSTSKRAAKSVQNVMLTYRRSGVVR
jgi:hypothetical protein